MKNRLIAILSAALLSLTLASCASWFGLSQPLTPQQTVYAVRLAEAASIQWINSIPNCPEAAPVCISQETRKTVAIAALAVNSAVEAAEATVRDPAFDNSDAAGKAAIAAKAAFASLVALEIALQAAQPALPSPPKAAIS